MRAFSDLLEALLFSPRRTVKLAHLVNWVRSTDDPDRGWGLAALTCDLSFSGVKSGVVRELAEQVTDPDLFALSYRFCRRSCRNSSLAVDLTLTLYLERKKTIII